MLLDIRCKTGKIQVTEQGLMKVVQPFGKVLWQANAVDVTGFAAQPGSLGALNVSIYTTNDVYYAELVSQANYEKLQACFPQLQAAQPGQAWYLNQAARSYVGTYTNAQQMQREIEAAALNGWVVQSQSAVGGHVSARKVIAGGILLGGVGALAGAGRSKDTITVTFGRSPEWLVQHR